MPTSSPEASRTATVLLITDAPWIYKALREALGLTKVETGASGVEYDTGTLPASDGVWKLMVPAEKVDGAALMDEVRPALVVYLGATHSGLHDASSPVLNSAPILECAPGVSAGGVQAATSPILLRRFERAMNRGAVLRGQMGERHLALPEPLWSAVASGGDEKHPAWIAIGVRVGSWTDSLIGLDPTLPPKHISELFRALLSPYALASLGASAARVTPTPPPPALIPVLGTLAGVELSSIRMFEQVRWAPGVSRPGWHVVLGDNASGKTSFLRALALALLPRAERDALRQDWSSWLRLDTARGHVGVSVVADSGASHTLSLSLERTSPGGSPVGGVVDVRTSETLQYNGFLAGYGPFRRFTGGDPEWLNSFRAHPRTQRVITLFEERAALSDALEWLKDLWVRAETVKPSPPEKPFLKQLLAFINTTDFLPTGVTLLEPNADGVWCQDANGRRVQVIELSDGYRAALSLALDLVRHLYVEHGAAKVFAGKKGKSLTIPAEGIVLIDEPDAHLHPTWQQRLGGWFKRCFPGMQFVVTTHSPIVCQAADSVLLLPNPGEEEPARMATPAELDRLRYGDVLDAFATDFFGRRVTRSQAGREKMDRLAALNLKAVQAGLDEAERAEQETLRAALGTAGEAPGAAS